MNPDADKALPEQQVANAHMSAQFMVMLSLSCVIASLGLMADSAAAVIGAMLISPLMKPIIALAYALVVGQRRIVLRSVVTIGVGIVLTIFVAGCTEQLFGLRGPTTELLARTQPSLLDLGVAVAAGIAAALATSRPTIADSLPGVAIAVALVPPLCAAGISISTQQWESASGSFELFGINLCAIIMCAAGVLLSDGRGKLRSALPGFAIVATLLGLLAPSLWRSMSELRHDDAAQSEVAAFLSLQYPINRQAHPDDLRKVAVIDEPDHVFVYVELDAPRDVFTNEQLEALRQRIARRLHQRVNLKVQFVLTAEVELYSHRPGETVPFYGADKPVPRR